MTGFVSFHGRLKTPEGQNYSETTGAILILLGSVDPVSGMNDVTNLVKELNDFEIQHKVHIYGGVRHSFTIKGSRDYSEKAEKKSWDALLSSQRKIKTINIFLFIYFFKKMPNIKFDHENKTVIVDIG